MPTLILQPVDRASVPVSVLWIHGGGYILGMKEMVYMSRAVDLVKQYGVTVYSPGYCLAWQKPYPAAVEYITDMEKVMSYGVMSMPAVVVNEQVVSMGKVLKPSEIEKLLK